MSGMQIESRKMFGVENLSPQKNMEFMGKTAWVQNQVDEELLPAVKWIQIMGEIGFYQWRQNESKGKLKMLNSQFDKWTPNINTSNTTMS